MDSGRKPIVGEKETYAFGSVRKVIFVEWEENIGPHKYTHVLREDCTQYTHINNSKREFHRNCIWIKCKIVMQISLHLMLPFNKMVPIRYYWLVQERSSSLKWCSG